MSHDSGGSAGHAGGWPSGHHRAAGSHHTHGTDGYWGIPGTGPRPQRSLRRRLANAALWLLAALALLLILRLTGY